MNRTTFNLQAELRAFADSLIAERSMSFFKTGAGEYGEGDVFLGIRVPTLRKLARQYSHLTLQDMLSLLRSVYHEERLLALIMLVNRFSKADKAEQQEIYDSYLTNTKYINGWDLVDSSAHQIMGGFLMDKKRGPLLKLARSTSLWERRIAIIATLHFIKNRQYEDTLKISKILLHDKEDLIHKAVGWMLREIGNRSRDIEEEFLNEHYKSMPRTMLRYAIEKFDPQQRMLYLYGEK